jgi:hypothetical protein
MGEPRGELQERTAVLIGNSVDLRRGSDQYSHAFTPYDERNEKVGVDAGCKGPLVVFGRNRGIPQVGPVDGFGGDGKIALERRDRDGRYIEPL